MIFFRYVYYFLMLLSFLLSMVVFKKEKGLFVFPILLFLGLSTEITRDILRFGLQLGERQFAPFHIYIPLEFGLISYYYLTITANNPIKLFIKILSVSVIISLIYISLSKGNWEIFPSLQYNISGCCVVLYVIVFLFSFPIDMHTSIFKKPAFWISFAFLLFYPSQFFMNGFYNYIEKWKPNLIIELSNTIYYSINYVLYLFFIVAFLCLIQIKKFS